MDTIPRIFQYEDKPISFINSEGTVMVNAAEMAKPFGKLASGWLRNQSTQDFIKELAAMRNCIPSDLVQVINGDKGGTWMHEDVALEFARWLAPKFAIWCNDRIKELLSTGVATVSNDDEAIAYAMEVLQKRLQKAQQEIAQKDAEIAQGKAEIELKDTRISEQQKVITESAPKVSYYDETLQSVNTVTTTQIAKEVGMDAAKLNRKLKDAGILFKQSGQWMLKQPYCRWNLASTRTTTFTRSDGSTGTNTYTVWSQRGRRFIHALNECGYRPREAVKLIKGLC